MKKSVLVDFRISEKGEETLINLGYNVIKTKRHSNLQEGICGHPDMLFCKLSNHDYVCENTFRGFLVKKFPDLNFIQGETELKPQYPFDIAYNCAKVGNYLFCKEEYTDIKILEYCANNNIKILNTNQGYAKCSICVVSDNAIITADKGIFKLAKEIGIDALLVENTGIILNGYDEGFIGGATGLLEKDLLCVNGNINLHKDYNSIKSFCYEHGVSIISLSNDFIYDIGTIFRL